MAAIAAALIVSAPGAQAQGPATGGGQVLTFTDEVPCPTATAAPRVRHVRHRIRRKRPIVRKAVVHVRRVPPHRVLAKHVVRKRRPVLVHAKAPISPTRCSVVRRERLTTASFGLTPEVAELSPIAADVEPGGPVLTALTSGRPALPNVINPTAGGGQPVSVNAAPEPDQWLLMLFGVAGLGITLRRRRAKAVPVS